MQFPSAIRMVMFPAATLLFALPAAAYSGQPSGKYCGALLSAGQMSEVETSFVRRADSGVITGTYVFVDHGEPTDGKLAEAGDDGDGNDLTRLFMWRDKYGYGKLVVTFTSDFSEFDGKWSDGGTPLAPWNGKRCSQISS